MTLRFIILGLLNYYSMTGYDLKLLMDKSTNFFWSAELSQIYRELSKLESLGYINSRIEPQEGRPDKKIYNITQEGKVALVEWLEDFPKVLSTPGKNEFLVRVFFSSNLRNKDILILQFENYIRELTKELKSYEPMEEEANKKFAKGCYGENNCILYHNLTLKRGISWAKAELDWANNCIKIIKDFYASKADNAKAKEIDENLS